jgi:hypothetical protein
MILKIKTEGIWKSFKSEFDHLDFVTMKIPFMLGQEAELGMIVDIQFNLHGENLIYCVSFPNGKMWHIAEELVKVELTPAEHTKPGFKK